MDTFADLEIGLHRIDTGRYGIELRYTQPDSDADIRLANPAQPHIFSYDPLDLREQSSDNEAYATYLSERFYTDEAFKNAFEKAMANAQALDAILRIRLFIGPGAPELHDIRWECLRDPAGYSLVLGEQIAFSRYLSSGDWQPVLLRPRGDLRALALIGNPSDLAEFGLAAVDPDEEVELIEEHLGDVKVDLVERDEHDQLTALGRTLRQTEKTPYDILYIVAHGALINNESWLWFEDREGKTARISGADLVQRIRELRVRPRLVVLLSCQSGGTGDEGAFAALGPRLAEAGIPAVIAMQTRVQVTTATRFMQSFFEELRRDGQIDQAVALARGDIRDEDDFWAPVLYMRLKSGRIWYVPGFGGEGRAAFEKWPSLLRSLRKGQCTPIIGAYLSEVFGSSRELAERWADTYNFPMSAAERQDLPQVAQYLAINQDRLFPSEELAEHLRQELLDNFPELLKGRDKDPINDLFAAVSAETRANNPTDAYAVLASLPMPVYITTNATNLLTEALRAAGKDPVVEICRWNEELEDQPSIFEEDPDYQPSPERPLIFHMFGVLSDPETLVLTEDNHFDFLIGSAQNKELIPIPVREALADTALLFLGFRLDQWDFRIVFRTLMSQQGRSRRSRYAHIAGQVMPEEGRFLEPERARRYLERYFDNANISIFWGSAGDFLQELSGQMSKETPRRR